MEQIENVHVTEAPAEKFPRCPYCKMDLETVWIKSSDSEIHGQKEILMCPHCESFLGCNTWRR